VEVWVQAANPKQQLRPGSAVQLQIVAQQVPDALIIPSAALLTSDTGENSVMVVGGDKHAHQQAVSPGIKQGDAVQIVSGLKKGDQVVTTGAYGLPDNAKVQVQSPAKPDAAQPESDPAGEKAGGSH